MLALTLMGILLGGEPIATDEVVDRGSGWYAPGAAVPEPPIGLALVIVGAAGMRLRERRRGRA